MRLICAAVFVLTSLTPGYSQSFTTAAEVRPILQATQSNWIAVREYDGRDLLYFTHLLAWRCGLDAIYYNVNDQGEAMFEAEPCYEADATPNAIKAEDRLPYLSLGLGSVETVHIRLVYDDGEEAEADFERASIQMP